MTLAGIIRPNGECYGHRSSSHPLPLARSGLWWKRHHWRKVVMKAKLAVIALGALVLMANGANAQHRTGTQTHARHSSHIFGQAYGYVPRGTPQYQSSGGLYESYSQGHQSYPNPDRELYLPD
jgi:hypothetical protein